MAYPNVMCLLSEIISMLSGMQRVKCLLRDEMCGEFFAVSFPIVITSDKWTEIAYLSRTYYVLKTRSLLQKSNLSCFWRHPIIHNISKSKVLWALSFAINSKRWELANSKLCSKLNAEEIEVKDCVFNLLSRKMIPTNRFTLTISSSIFVSLFTYEERCGKLSWDTISFSSISS